MPAAALATLLAGCGGVVELLPGDRIDRGRMHAVADDEGATASEVVPAGRAVDAARSGDTLLVAYTVSPDTSEGRSAGAWRLYDADGDTIATELAGVTHEGAASPDVVAGTDGYLVRAVEGRAWHVSPDGTRARVPTARRPLSPQAGDIPLHDGSARLYRPTTRTVFTPAPRATGNWQGWTVTDDGTLWLQRLGRAGRIPFSRSTAAGTWEPAATYTPGAGQAVSSLALTAVGEHIVVPLTVEGRDATRARLVGLLVRPSDAPADQAWELLEAGAVGGDSWYDAKVAAVDGSTVAVGAWGEPPYLVDLLDGGWRRMQAPTDERGWVYAFEDGGIYATHSGHADAWVSEDRGGSWSRLPH